MVANKKCFPVCRTCVHKILTPQNPCAHVLTSRRAALGYVAACVLLLFNTTELHAGSKLDPNNTTVLIDDKATASAPAWPLIPPPIEHCEGVITHSEPVVVAPLRKPPHMKLFRDPAFMTKNRRITDSLGGQVQRPLGLSAQSWNSDESLLLLQQHDVDGAVKFMLMDGSTYQSLGELNISSAVKNSVYWSRENPLSAIYVANSEDKAGQLLRFDIATGTESLIKDFTPYCEQKGYPAIGGQFPKPSSNDDLFSFQCGSNSGNSLIISYRYSSDAVHTLVIGEGTPWNLNQAPQSTASGERFIFQGVLIDDTLQKITANLAQFDSKSVLRMAKDSQNNDVVFQLSQSLENSDCAGSDNKQAQGLVFKHNLSNGECDSFVTQFNNDTPSAAGAALFTDAEHAPDWAAMSSIGYGDFENFTKDTPVNALFSEILLVNTSTGNKQEVCRIAHHRAFGKDAQNANYQAELGEPIVTLSPSGTRVLFSSDWYDSGSVDTFVVELPAFTRLQLGGEWADVQEPNRVTRFVQAGAKFAFTRSLTVDADKNPQLTTGTGSISGRQIDLKYVTTVLNKKVTGQCSATVQRNIDNLIFNCQDNSTGAATFNIMRR